MRITASTRSNEREEPHLHQSKQHSRRIKANEARKESLFTFPPRPNEATSIEASSSLFVSLTSDREGERDAHTDTWNNWSKEQITFLFHTNNLFNQTN